MSGDGAKANNLASLASRSDDDTLIGYLQDEKLLHTKWFSRALFVNRLRVTNNTFPVNALIAKHNKVRILH